MEQYKEKVRVSIIIYGVAVMILGVFSLLGIISEAGIVSLTPVVDNSHWQSMWRGFLFGASFGLLGFMVFGLIRNIRALKDENILKKHYIQDTDERQIKIWTAARATSMQIFVLGGLVAGIIAAYFSMTVGITIIACLTIDSFIGLFCKIYYDIKF